MSAQWHVREASVEMALEILLPCSRVSGLRLSHECLCKHPHVVLETHPSLQLDFALTFIGPLQSAYLTYHCADTLRPSVLPLMPDMTHAYKPMTHYPQARGRV